MPLYLGLDSSTQSLTATVIDPAEHRVVFHQSINFDDELPHYGTRNGVIRHENPLVVTSPPLMWVEALDRMMELVSRQNTFEPSQIAAIAGVDGREHRRPMRRARASVGW
jgi:xylulokinase